MLRITLSVVPFLVSIVLGWDWITDALAQGATYLVRGWWASLIGAFVVVMASLVPLSGALGSILVAILLRLRPPAAVGILADRWLLLYGPAVFLGTSWATWRVMWLRQPPMETEYAHFDAPYFWTAALVGGSLAIGAGAYVSDIVLRSARQRSVLPGS